MADWLNRYIAAVLADHPVAYWPLQETEGVTAYDYSPNGNHGTLQGGVTLGQPGPWPGSFAAKFDGNTGYISFPSTAWIDAIGNAFTIECWATTAPGVLLGSDSVPVRQTPAEGWQPLLWFSPANILTGSGYTQNGGSAISTPNAVTTGFHHCALTVEAGTNTLYVDGIITAGPANLGGPTYGSATNFFTIGVAFTEYWVNTPGGWFFYGGTLGHLAIYPTALTAAQVAAHYFLPPRSGGPF